MGDSLCRRRPFSAHYPARQNAEPGKGTNGSRMGSLPFAVRPATCLPVPSEQPHTKNHDAGDEKKHAVAWLGGEAWEPRGAHQGGIDNEFHEAVNPKCDDGSDPQAKVGK